MQKHDIPQTDPKGPEKNNDQIKHCLVYFESEEDCKKLKDLTPSVSIEEINNNRNIKKLSFTDTKELDTPWKHHFEGWKRNGVKFTPLNFEPDPPLDNKPTASSQKIDEVHKPKLAIPNWIDDGPDGPHSDPYIHTKMTLTHFRLNRKFFLKKNVLKNLNSFSK